MPNVPLPGTMATAGARYTCFSVAPMSRMTPWKAPDMWLSARSVNTTEYSQ